LKNSQVRKRRKAIYIQSLRRSSPPISRLYPKCPQNLLLSYTKINKNTVASSVKRYLFPYSALAGQERGRKIVGENWVALWEKRGRQRSDFKDEQWAWGVIHQIWQSSGQFVNFQLWQWVAIQEGDSILQITRNSNWQTKKYRIYSQSLPREGHPHEEDRTAKQKHKAEILRTLGRTGLEL